MNDCNFSSKFKCNARQTLGFIGDRRNSIGNFAKCMTSPQYGNCRCSAYQYCNKAGVCYDFVKACHDTVLAPFKINNILSHCIVDGVDMLIRSEQALMGLPIGTVLKITNRLLSGNVVNAIHSFIYVGNGEVAGTNWAFRYVNNRSAAPQPIPSLCCNYKYFFLFSSDAILLYWDGQLEGSILYANHTHYLYANVNNLNSYILY